MRKRTASVWHIRVPETTISGIRTWSRLRGRSVASQSVFYLEALAPLGLKEERYRIIPIRYAPWEDSNRSIMLMVSPRLKKMLARLSKSYELSRAQVVRDLLAAALEMDDDIKSGSLTKQGIQKEFQKLLARRWLRDRA